MQTLSWKALAPVLLAIVLALLPTPPGLEPHAWYYFAIFAGVILGLMRNHSAEYGLTA